MKYLLLLFLLCLSCSDEDLPSGSSHLDHLKRIDVISTLYFNFSDRTPMVQPEDVLDITELGVRVKNTVEPCSSIEYYSYDGRFVKKCFIKKVDNKLIPHFIVLETSRTYDSDEFTEKEFREEAHKKGFDEIKVGSFLNYNPFVKALKSDSDTLHFYQK